MRGGRGGRVAPLGVSRRRRKQEVAGVWPRALATRSSSSWREEDDDGKASRLGRARWAGPSQVGWASTGKAQVGFPLSLFFDLFLFFYLTATVGLY